MGRGDHRPALLRWDVCWHPEANELLAPLTYAAEDARRIAIQTGTELIVMSNGQICSLPPEEIAKLPPVVES